jgi:hypothetical protein
MVVMGLMILVTSIVVTGSFGMTRSSSYRVAQDVVYNTLQMARQRACTDGKRVIVAFALERGGNYEDNALSVIEATGTITEEVTENYIQDRCANLVKYAESGGQSSGMSTNTVWNLRTGASFTGFSVARNDDITYRRESIPGTAGDRYQYTVTTITPRAGGFSQSYWKKGDPYGFQIAQSQTLPKGFKIGYDGVGVSPADKLLVFEPNGSGFVGTASDTGIAPSSDTAELYLYEEIFKDDSGKAVRVKFSKGIISVVRQ